MIIDFSDIPVVQKQNLLVSAAVPRPIGLISTIDEDGISNLAPLSFFNVVSFDPRVIIFSPLRRLRDCTTKHTFENILERPMNLKKLVSPKKKQHRLSHG